MSWIYYPTFNNNHTVPLPDYMPQTLKQIYDKHFDGTWPDMGSVHSYLEIYEELLAPYRFTAKNILEIGLFTGARLKIWESYFSGTVHGIDCDEQPHGGMADLRPMIASGKHNIHIFDAMDTAEIKKRFSGVLFDVIIEDAGHSIESQVDLYNAWKPYLAPGSLYIIEDIQNLDRDKGTLVSLDPERTAHVYDLRGVKQRYDDVIIVYK